MSNDPPESHPVKDYENEIGVYLEHLPELLAAEEGAREQYDPQRIAEQQALQAYFGPTQYAQQLDALHQLDPEGTKIRSTLGTQIEGQLKNPENSDVYNALHDNVLSGLNSGYSLGPDLEQQLNNQIRGAQAARGNTDGNAAISSEALFKGQAGIDLYNSRLQNAEGFYNLNSPTQKAFDNAGQFLGLATPEQQIQAITPVTPDRTSAYVDPNIGLQGQQLGASLYPGQLAAYQAQGNPWARALSGAASGAAAGASSGSGWGAVLGAVAGGVGGYASDSRLKENVTFLGVSPTGLPVVSFNYIWDKARRYVGTMADKVSELMPAAVGESHGFKTVNYSMIDVPFMEVS